MFRFLGLLFISLISFSGANAAILIEPVIGYTAGARMEIKDFEFAGTTVEGDSASGGSGFSYGGRLGYQNLGFQVGLDYLNTSLNIDDMKDGLAINEYAAFVGFEFPVLFRVYGGYIFSANGEGKTDDGDKFTMTDGSGFKAGLGFTLLPFLDINFEYRRATFGEWKSGSNKIDGDIDTSAYMIGLSLPFTI